MITGRGLNLSLSKQGSVSASCEQSDKPSGSVKRCDLTS